MTSPGPSGPPYPGGALTDYAAEGPGEAREIIAGHPACQTAPNGTAARCTCAYDCANYWLRAAGYTARPA